MGTMTEYPRVDFEEFAVVIPEGIRGQVSEDMVRRALGKVIYFTEGPISGVLPSLGGSCPRYFYLNKENKQIIVR